SAGTGKSFIIHQFKLFLERSKRKYILLAPTGVAAQNVGGKTIHSELKITSSNNTSSGYKTLIFSEKSTQTKLKEIDTIIIEEISMVSSTLFTFLSEIFARLHET
ncbi:3720_t:CDS:1, partial [Paraglomus occultum]